MGIQPNASYHISNGEMTISDVAQEKEMDGEIFLGDIGQGLFFRPGVFDGAIRCVLVCLCELQLINKRIKYIRHTMAL